MELEHSIVMEACFEFHFSMGSKWMVACVGVRVKGESWEQVYSTKVGIKTTVPANRRDSYNVGTEGSSHSNLKVNRKGENESK